MWFDQNFKEKSDALKKMKGLINESFAHSSLAYAFQNFRIEPSGRKFHTPFFDLEDEYRVRAHLWWVANIAMGLLDLFYGVNNKYKVVQFVDDFLENFQSLVEQNNKLKKEMMSSDRFKKVKGLDS